jgi:hypothetical protein
LAIEKVGRPRTQQVLESFCFPVRLGKESHDVKTHKKMREKRAIPWDKKNKEKASVISRFLLSLLLIPFAFAVLGLGF